MSVKHIGNYWVSPQTCLTLQPSFSKVMLYRNMCATVIIGTRIERPNICRTESVSIYRSLFGIELVKNENNQNAKVNQLILYLIVTRQLKIIYYTIKNKCASHYKDNQFFTLSKARSDFYLSDLESVFITLRTLNL